MIFLFLGNMDGRTDDGEYNSPPSSLGEAGEKYEWVGKIFHTIWERAIKKKYGRGTVKLSIPPPRSEKE